MIYALNYANDKYRKQQELNTESALKYGKVDKVFSYTEDDIVELKKELPEHFKFTRGNGLWVWKPYLALKTLAQINYGDYLFYSDSGAIYINDIRLLIPDLTKSGSDIMVFELPLLESYYTKKETFELLKYKDYTQNQILATFFLLKKTDKSIEFMKLWLDTMKDIRILSPLKYIDTIQEFPWFRSHREDQSIFSILCRQWNIPVFRDPSDLGIFPWSYLRAGGYHKKKYPNSHYPAVVLCVRKNEPIKYQKDYIRALKYYRLGLNNEFIARIKLLPMYIKHGGRLFFNTIGLKSFLDRILKKNITK